MWPKAISQLIELAPHVARLLPMADRFFQAKTADTEASRSAMQQMAEGLRGDLGQVTAAHAGLYKQLNDQSEVLALHGEKLDALSAELHLTKLAADTLEASMAVSEARLRILVTLVCVLLAVTIAVGVLVTLLLLHHH